MNFPELRILRVLQDLYHQPEEHSKQSESKTRSPSKGAELKETTGGAFRGLGV